MPNSKLRRQKPNANPKSVFLNIPYDAQFENLFLAYIAAISAFGFIPRATLEIPFSRRRLDRITDLVEKCEYSIHYLSRVQINRTRPSTPRFNMPFELGIAVGLTKRNHPGHAWVVFESESHRIQKSLSDLNGTDVYIHGATILGVFREFGNIFVRSHRQPSVQQMRTIYRTLRGSLKVVLRKAGQTSPFNARVFRDLCVIASAVANETVTT